MTGMLCAKYKFHNKIYTAGSTFLDIYVFGKESFLEWICNYNNLMFESTLH